MDRIKLGFKKIIKTIRYRFFLFAGLFPYLLGQILAFGKERNLNWQNFWWGLLGVILVLIGVELFNEYFDAKEGGDRIFFEERPNIPGYFLLLALGSMLFAFFIGLYLTFRTGWPILLLSFLGFFASYFYVGRPFRWSYRGLGEIVISLSYGPLMILGSYYLQTKSIDFSPIFVSLILGLLIFSLSLVNEIPDYYQDRLVGKKNLVVRLGKRASVKLFSLCLIFVFILLGIGMLLEVIPQLSIITFILLPVALSSINIARNQYESPLFFLPAIRRIILVYISTILFLGIGYLGV